MTISYSKNGITTFEQDGRVSQIDTGGDFYEYTYDNASRVTGISNASDGNLTWGFGYDDLDRLTDSVSAPHTEAAGLARVQVTDCPGTGASACFVSSIEGAR